MPHAFVVLLCGWIICFCSPQRLNTSIGSFPPVNTNCSFILRSWMPPTNSTQCYTSIQWRLYCWILFGSMKLLALRGVSVLQIRYITYTFDWQTIISMCFCLLLSPSLCFINYVFIVPPVQLLLLSLLSFFYYSFLCLHINNICICSHSF